MTFTITPYSVEESCIPGYCSQPRSLYELIYVVVDQAPDVLILKAILLLLRTLKVTYIGAILR
jgi:hypothetical protein